MKPRGFATLTPERRREIASMGGKRAQAIGAAHRWSSEEAKAAGRRGGLAANRRLPIIGTLDERLVTGER